PPGARSAPRRRWNWRTAWTRSMPGPRRRGPSTPRSWSCATAGRSPSRRTRNGSCRNAPTATASTARAPWSGCLRRWRSPRPCAASPASPASRHRQQRRPTMTGAQFGTFLLGLIVVAIVVAIAVWLLHWLYLRSSKERSFVRTGLGGTKVVLGGGAFVLPILHDVIPVNMNTLRLEVSRGRDKALITKDRMRVDVTAEFYVRVQASTDSIANAAQTLGTRTLHPEQLGELVEGKFVDALRTVAAEMTMEEMHEKRGDYVRKVRAAVVNDLLVNGLELETVSLTQLDQTGMEFFNPSNAFDAEGLTRLTEQIERRKKIRNDIEQDTMIQIRNKNLDTERQALDIDRELEYARLAQERELEIQRAAQRADVARERAEKDQEAERAQISARETIERSRLAAERSVEEARISKERDLQEVEIARRKAIELAEQQRAIAIAEQSRAQSEAQAAADRARAEAVQEEERVFTVREVEMAERRKQIELITARQEAERDGVRLMLA